MHRTAALFIAIVAILHLVGQHLWLGESPVWFNSIFLIWFHGLDRAIDQWIIGLAIAFVVFVLAWMVGAKQSRLAALLFLVIAGWDAFGRYRQVNFTLANDDLALGTPMIAGAVATGFALLVALFAVIATFRRRPQFF